MLILLEGPDGGGKSTLAEALCTVWGSSGTRDEFHLIHTGPPDPPDRCIFEEYELQLDALAERCVSSGELVIMDRWHLGDPVYARYRAIPKNRTTPAGVLHIDMAISALGVKVMCLPPLKVIQERVARDGDWLISQDDLPRIHAEYATMADLYGYIVPNWQLDPSVAAKSLIRRAFGRAHLAAPLWTASAGTYIGSTQPNVVFAGDELGGSTEKGTCLGFRRPFTPKLPGSCSEWLLRALLAAGNGIVSNCGLVNANQPGVGLAKLRQLTPSARWVALGQRSARALESAGISHRVEQHPQYARRFRHSDLAGYAAELAAAAEAQ